MSNGLSVQNSRVHKLGTFEPSTGGSGNASYNMSNGFGSAKANWGGSIWGNGGLKGNSIDGSTDVFRRKGSLATSVAEEVEGKTGSSSLLESSESEGWNRNHRVPWTVNGTNVNQNSSLSPVRQRLTEPAGTNQAAHNTGRSTSPFFTLNADVEGHEGLNNLQQRLSPPAANGSLQQIPDASPFGGFSTRQLEGISPSTTSSVQHMPSLSRSISHNDTYAARGNFTGANDGTISRTLTTSSIPTSRAPGSGAHPPLAHGGQTSSSTKVQRPSHSSHPSFHTIAYDSLDRSGGEDIEFVPNFARLNLQNGDSFTSIQAGDAVSTHMLTPRDVASDRQKYQLPQSSAYPTPMSQGFEAPQEQNYQYAPQGYLKNGTSNINGYMTSNPGNYRRGMANQPYSSSSTPPNMPDMLNPSSQIFSVRGSDTSAAALDRKLRGLQPLQQEPASYIPGQINQQANSQGRMSYSPYEYASYPAARMTPLTNVYGMPPYVGLVQAPVGPRYQSRDEPIRSALLEEFRTNSRTNKRFELKDIYGHVVEFAGDQHGSRFIQQKLETANSDEKDQIFKEIQPNSLQLMTDLFGNYVIQKLFEHGNQTQKRILANQMKGHVRSLSVQMYGCRVVQKALEHILTDQQAALINELNGKSLVLECVRDQNGNHVIQKAIERVPPEHIQFIIDAFLGQVAQLATHAYGCRVIQRMLEHCKDPSRRQILDELHACIPNLIIDQFGNYVIQHVIQHGDETDRYMIVSIVVSNVLGYSKHKFASNVVEKSIECGAPQQRAEILRLLTAPNEQGETPVLALVRDQYGNYVIQKVLNVLKGVERDNIITQIRPHIPSLKKISCGKQIIAIEKIILDADYETNQSSQSSSLPSTNASTVDGPVTPGACTDAGSPLASLNGSIDEATVKTPTGRAIVSGVGLNAGA